MAGQLRTRRSESCSKVMASRCRVHSILLSQSQTSLTGSSGATGANTTYRVSVELNSTTPLPAELTGPQALTSTFTNSDTLSPAFKLIGKLKPTLRIGSAPLQQCGPCGADCLVVGQRPAVYVDVETPLVRGGFDRSGYQAWLTLSDAAAPTFSALVRESRRAKAASSA
jgi:hypothetical protein